MRVVNLFAINEYFLEYFVLFDFATDLYITVKLMNSRHTMWATLTFVAILAPVLVCSY